MRIAGNDSFTFSQLLTPMGSLGTFLLKSAPVLWANSIMGCEHISGPCAGAPRYCCYNNLHCLQCKLTVLVMMSVVHFSGLFQMEGISGKSSEMYHNPICGRGGQFLIGKQIICIRKIPHHASRSTTSCLSCHLKVQFVI